MPDTLATATFPLRVTVENPELPVRVMNPELNVQVKNTVKVTSAEKLFSLENTHTNGMPSDATIQIGGDNRSYLIEFIAATMVGPNQRNPYVEVKLHSGIRLQFQLVPGTFAQRVNFVVKPNESIKISVAGHSIGQAGETTSSMYVSGKVLE